MSRPVAIACPACAGALPAITSAFLDCPSCKAPVAVLADDAPPRAVEPSRLHEHEALRSAAKLWSEERADPRFRAATGAQLTLVFAPFYEVERTEARSGSASYAFLPATRIPGLPLERMSDSTPVSRSTRQPFVPKALPHGALVFDPTLTLEEAAPRDGAVLEEHVSVLLRPIWLIRKSHGRNLYEASVDAKTGQLLAGRAPVSRASRLPQALGLIYALALFLALPSSVWVGYFKLLSHFDEAGLAAGMFTPVGLAWLLVWAWDRLRFRYELAFVDGQARLQPVNRPARTLPERFKDVLLKIAVTIAKIVSR